MDACNSMNHWSSATATDIPEFEHSPISEPPVSPTEKQQLIGQYSPITNPDTDFELSLDSELQELNAGELEAYLHNQKAMDSTGQEVVTYENLTQMKDIPKEEPVFSQNSPSLLTDIVYQSFASCNNDSYPANVTSQNMQMGLSQVSTDQLSTSEFFSPNTNNSMPSSAEDTIDLIDISQIKTERPDSRDQGYASSVIDEWNNLPTTSEFGFHGATYHQEVQDEDACSISSCAPTEPGETKPQKRLKLKYLAPEERKARRRMQNRDAARRCRMKKRASANTLAQDYQRLLSNQRNMTEEIENLRKDKERLENMLREHCKICPIIQHRRC